jgi:type III secretion protein Q
MRGGFEVGHLEALRRPVIKTQPFLWPALPELTAEDVRLHAACGGASGATRHSLGHTGLLVTGPLPRRLPAPGARVTVAFGDIELVVVAPADALAAVMAAHKMSDSWERFEAATAAMVLEHLLADMLKPLEPVLGGPFRVTAYAASVMAPLQGSVSFDVAVDGAAGRAFAVSAAPDVVAKLVTLLAGPVPQKHQADVGHIPFVARLVGPSFTLTAADYLASAVGDGFLLERDWAALAEARLTIADTVGAPARHTEHGFVLQSDLTQFQSEPENKGGHMSIETDIAPAKEDVLPVIMTIELARTRISVGDLRDMAAGSVLPFASDLPAEVGLLANGKPFGRGELVRVDGKIAVRLTQVR